MRSAIGQAQSAATKAADTSTQLGTEAQGIGSTLTPFLTSELEHPQGYSQQDESAMLAAGDAGAGHVLIAPGDGKFFPKIEILNPRRVPSPARSYSGLLPA